ncbi:DUF393 domain-containing protein [Pseudoalteromonas piscicida]|uniref:thiol-disulfide oxidoreductase DCC family protein n=1 Tax=Pseudoalteromonas piscicida TaxID=43662 RepID=UPI0030A01128
MIVFYDGNCPLCRKEMDALKRVDHADKVELVDIHSNRFECEFTEITKQDAMEKLHAYNESGELIFGLDVTVAVWKAVGKHRWLSLLRLPGIRWVADKAYLFFAAHRMKISKLLMPSQCNIQGNCNRD